MEEKIPKITHIVAHLAFPLAKSQSMTFQLREVNQSGNICPNSVLFHRLTPSSTCHFRCLDRGSSDNDLSNDESQISVLD